MGYVESRCVVYAPVYAALVERTRGFLTLLGMVHDYNQNVIILDSDVPADGILHRVTPELLEERIANPLIPFGHGNVVAGLLQQIKPEVYCRPILAEFKLQEHIAFLDRVGIPSFFIYASPEPLSPNFLKRMIDAFEHLKGEEEYQDFRDRIGIPYCRNALEISKCTKKENRKKITLSVSVESAFQATALCERDSESFALLLYLMQVCQYPFPGESEENVFSEVPFTEEDYKWLSIVRERCKTACILHDYLRTVTFATERLYKESLKEDHLSILVELDSFSLLDPVYWVNWVCDKFYSVVVSTYPLTKEDEKTKEEVQLVLQRKWNTFQFFYIFFYKFPHSQFLDRLKGVVQGLACSMDTAYFEEQLYEWILKPEQN